MQIVSMYYSEVSDETVDLGMLTAMLALKGQMVHGSVSSYDQMATASLNDKVGASITMFTAASLEDFKKVNEATEKFRDNKNAALLWLSNEEKPKQECLPVVSWTDISKLKTIDQESIFKLNQATVTTEVTTKPKDSTPEQKPKSFWRRILG